MIDDNVLNPKITAAARCHGCNEIVLYGTRQCPYCGIELNQREMKARAIESVKIDQAIASANTIRTFNLAIIISLIVAICRLFIHFGLRLNISSSILWLFSLATIVQWWVKHGGWKSSEEDYLSSKKAMKLSLAGWLVVNLLNGITFFISTQ